MTRLTWLPDVLRDAGLTVHEVDGWETRGSSTFDPRGIICHATAGSPNSTDAGEIRVLLTGSTSAPPPIAQLYLSRTGAWHVVASGRCNHALQGWGGPLSGYGNTHLIGVEAANDNRGQPWPAVQVDAYQRGVAAICRQMGWTADRNVAAHREHQPGSKSDPFGIDMTRFRQRVTALLAGEDDDMTPAQMDDLAKRTAAAVLNMQLGRSGPALGTAVQTTYSEVAKIRAGLAEVAGRDLVDEPAIVAGVLAGLAPEVLAARIAEHLPADHAQRVVDELAARLTTTGTQG